jgi:sec-independent protein translocase protein TatA
MSRIATIQSSLVAAAVLFLGGCTFGPQELIIILVIVVLLFGASRLPQLGKAVGETVKNFKESTGDALDGSEKKQIEAKEVAKIEEAKVERVEENSKKS